MALWPNGFDLSQLRDRVEQGPHRPLPGNTVAIAIGSWAAQLTVATTAGFALSVLRPRGAPVLTALTLATLFVPPIVLLVPLYLTVVKLPIVGISLVNDYWAIWLPAGASALNVILVKRFFDNLPREIFEAARVDGAGPFRLFWSVVLPMSRPIIGVVSVFAVIATWKDYLWPLLVLREPSIQPLSVRLPILAPTTDLGRVHRRAHDLEHLPDRPVPRLPAPVPVGRRGQRGDQGLTPVLAGPGPRFPASRWVPTCSRLDAVVR